MAVVHKLEKCHWPGRTLRSATEGALNVDKLLQHMKKREAHKNGRLLIYSSLSCLAKIPSAY